LLLKPLEAARQVNSQTADVALHIQQYPGDFRSVASTSSLLLPLKSLWFSYVFSTSFTFWFPLIVISLAAIFRFTS